MELTNFLIGVLVLGFSLAIGIGTIFYMRNTQAYIPIICTIAITCLIIFIAITGISFFGTTDSDASEITIIKTDPESQTLFYENSSNESDSISISKTPVIIKDDIEHPVLYKTKVHWLFLYKDKYLYAIPKDLSKLTTDELNIITK